MKRLIAVLVIAVVGVAGFAASPAAGHEPGTEYFIGKGDSLGAEVAFRVSKGKVKDPIVKGTRLPCAKKDFGSFFFGLPKTDLDGTKFYVKQREPSGTLRWTGHVRKNFARGRVRINTSSATSGVCKTGPIRWQALEVDKTKWQEVSGYQPGA